MDKTTLAGRAILSAMLLSLGSSQIVWALDASGDTSIPPILSWDYYNESYYGKAFVNNIILGSQSYNTINGSNNIILNSGGRSHNAFNTVNGNSVNIGSNIYTGNTSTGIGDAVFAGDCSVAIGDAIYNHNDSQGIGYYTKDNIRPTGDHSVALGSSIEANGYASIALGRSVKANGHDSIAIGTMSASLGEGSVAIGSKSYASMEEYVVSFGHKIGENATTFGINVSQDSDLDANGKYKNTLTRRLINITDGIDNSDAATKGQVISRATFSDNILTLARNNGKDNITVDLSELVTDDSLNVKYTDNTKSAVDIGNASFSTTGVGSFGSVSVGGNTYIDSNGINANSKVISNVAAAVKDTDAVNKKQMEDADSKVLKDSKEYTDVKVTDLEAKDDLNVKYTDNTKSAVDIGNASFSTTGVGSFGSVSVGGNTYIDNNGINANNKVISNVAGPVKDTDAANKSYVDVSAADTLQNAKDYTDGKVADLAASDSLSVKYTDNTKSAVDIGSASISTTGRGDFGSISVAGNAYIDSNGINANNKVISNVAGPVKDTDAANKSYVDVSAANTLQNAKDYTDGKVADLTASDSLSVKYTDNTKSAVDIGSASISTTGRGDFGSISVAGNAYIDSNGINANNKVISNVAGPVKDTDAANKSYVDVSAANTLQNAKDYTDGKVADLTASDSLSVKYTDNTKSAVDIGSASISTTGRGDFGSISVAGNAYIDSNGINANNKVISNVAAAVKDTDAVNKKQMEDADSKVLKDSKEYTDVKVTDLEAKDALNVKYTDNTKSAVDIGNASFSTTGVGSFGSVSVGGNTYIDSNGINANNKVISNVAAAVKDTDAVNKKQMEDADSKVLKDSKEYTDVKVTDLEAKDALNVKYTDNTKSAVDIGNASFSTTGVGSFGSVSVGGNTYIDSNGINANNKVISNVAAAVKDTDAVNKKQMEDADSKVLKNSKEYTDVKVTDLEAKDALNVKYTDNTKSAVDIGNASFSTTGVGSFGSVSVGGNTYIDSNGINANNKVISNVAAAVKDTDAVNKKQMEDADSKVLKNSKEYTDVKVTDLEAKDALNVKYTDNTKSAVDIGNASFSTTGVGSFGSVSVGSNTYIDSNGINANSKVISNVAGPIKDTDAANKSYVDVSAADTLQNAKDYTDGKVADLAASDSLSVKYTDNTKSAVDIGSASISTTGRGDFGSISVGGNAYIDSNGINANNKVISNVAGPVKDTDAANKSYVDVSAANTLQNAKDYTDGKVADLTASDSLSVKYTDNTKSAVDIGSASISTTGRGNFGSISVGGNTYIDDKGIDANSKVISNVAAAVKDTDAVNKKQMEAADDKILETSKVYTDTKIKNVTVDALREANDYTDLRFNNLDQKINKTGAATAAMAGLHPLEFDEEQKLNFAVATGGYHGSSAIALGMFYRPNENVMFNLSGSTSGSEHMYSLGASFALDRPSDTHVSSRRALTEKVQQLSKVNEAVIKQSMELQAKNDELQSQIAELRQIVMEMKKSA